MEGLAREFVRRIQDNRKKADFDIADRIRIVYRATDDLKTSTGIHMDYIKAETLATELVEGDPEKDMFVTTVSFEGEEVTLGLEVVE